MYEDSFSSRRSPSLIPLFGVAGLVILIVVGALLVRQAPLSTPQAIEAELERDPAARQWGPAFRNLYPREYRAMLERLAAAGRDSGRPALAREGAAFMRGFFLSKVEAMARAPDAQLVELARLMAAVVVALRDQDVGLCARFLTSGIQLGTVPPRSALPLLDRTTAAMISAARAGDDSRFQPRPRPSEAELSSWMDRVRLIDPRTVSLLESDALDGAAPAQQCRSAVALFQGITELPHPVAAAIMASIFREARTIGP